MLTLAAKDYDAKEIRKELDSVTYTRKLVKKFHGFELRKTSKQKDGDVWYVLFDKEDIIGYIGVKKITINDIRGYQVTRIGLLEEYRGTGLVYKLYDYFLKKGPMWSDLLQTADGKKIWHNLKKHGINVLAYEHKTHKLYETSLGKKYLKSNIKIYGRKGNKNRLLAYKKLPSNLEI